MDSGGWNGSGGLADLQNRVGGAQRGSGGFDSHTLPPRRLSARGRRSPVGRLIRYPAFLAAALAAFTLNTSPAAAQDSAAVAAPDSAARVPADSLAPPVADSLAADTIVTDSLVPSVDQAPGDTTARTGPSPTGAMVKSLLLPGLGQISLGRKLTAAVFVAFEGATLAMVIKSQRELNDARAASGGEETALVMEKSRKREDWLVLMGLNHVFAGLEAYVSAHLWDFPGDIQIRALPEGGVHAAASIPLRFP